MPQGQPTTQQQLIHELRSGLKEFSHCSKLMVDDDCHDSSTLAQDPGPQQPVGPARSQASPKAKTAKEEGKELFF